MKKILIGAILVTMLAAGCAKVANQTGTPNLAQDQTQSDSGGSTSGDTTPVSGNINVAGAIDLDNLSVGFTVYANISAITATPASVAPGAKSTIKVTPSTSNKGPLTYTYLPQAGYIEFPAGVTGTRVGNDLVGKSPTIIWTLPKTPGTYMVRVIGDDGSTRVLKRVYVTVTAPVAYSAPVISGVSLSKQAITQGDPVTVTVVATDPNNQTLTYSFTADGTITKTTLPNVVSWTPEQTIGVHTINAGVANSSKAVSMNAQVSVTTKNYPPVISSVILGTTSLLGGASTAVTVQASDPNGDSIAYSFTGPGTITQTSAVNIVTWTPPVTAGTYSIKALVADNEFTVSKSATITVTVPAPIPPPPAPTPPPATGVIAFPGAEGYGAQTRGAFGNPNVTPIIYHVTTTAGDTTHTDSTHGSLRYALESVSSATQPLFIVFDIGGTINLSAGIGSRGNYITIAGQTTPANSGGITISGGGIYFHGHDIIVRGLRFRNGFSGTTGDRKNAAFVQDDGSNTSIPYNYVFDHCSFNWADDENLTFYGNNSGGLPFGSGHDITVQKCFINEGIRTQSGFGGNGHSANSLVGYNWTNISYHHNLMSNSVARCGVDMNAGSKVLLANNVIFGWIWHATQLSGIEQGTGISSEWQQPQFVDIIQNYYKCDTSALAGNGNSHPIFINNHNGDASWNYIAAGSKMYLYKNYSNGYNPNATTAADASLITGDYADTAHITPWISATRTLADPQVPITIEDASSAAATVINTAGCRTGAGLDTPDQGYVNDFNAGKATVHPQGWIPTLPFYATGTTPADNNGNGIPDTYENAHGGNINEKEINPVTGYTYLEDYVNSLIQ